MNPLRVRAIFGAVTAYDPDPAVTQVNPNSALVTITGTLADGAHTFNVVPLGSDPIPITHNRTGSETPTDVRDGWVTASGGATPSGDLANYIASVEATPTAGQVRVTFLDRPARPCRISVEATPNDPTSSIAIAGNDCFPNVFYVPPPPPGQKSRQLMVSFDPVSFTDNDPVANPVGVPLADDNGMTISFELVPVITRSELFGSGAVSGYGVSTTQASSYKHGSEVTGHSVQDPYVFDDIMGGFYHLRVHAQANTPTGHDGLEASVQWS